MGSINLAISEKLLPSIQNTLGSQRQGFRDDVDHRSSRLSRTTEAEISKRACKTALEYILTPVIGTTTAGTVQLPLRV